MKKSVKIIILLLSLLAVGYSLFEKHEIDPQEAAVQKEIQKRRLQGC
jgi:uncharacterized protein YxeA